MVSDFEKKQTRTFETHLLTPWQPAGSFRDFNSYKIDYDAGM
jgi:hypothetical protein